MGNTDSTATLINDLTDSDKTLIITTIQKMANTVKNKKYEDIIALLPTRNVFSSLMNATVRSLEKCTATSIDISITAITSVSRERLSSIATYRSIHRSIWTRF